MKWKPDWPETKQHFKDWWNQEGLVVTIPAPREEPIEDFDKPEEPDDLKNKWIAPDYLLKVNLWALANRYYGGDAFPSFSTNIGPGSLGTLIGAEPVFEPTTVWYEPCIDDPDEYGAIEFDPEDNEWLDVHMDIIRTGVEHAGGRYLVGMPDLIENVDTLAAMRGSETLLMDLVQRPDWVKEKVREINQAYFDAFDCMYEWIKDDEGGNVFEAFRLWGPGKTAKTQCDFSCMISEKMFGEFVVPALEEQCKWLDYSMYHLDGTTALQHLDALLDIEPLQAIEWTPEVEEGGGHPRWYDMYRRIKDAGKSVQAIGVRADEVEPLLDAVGPEGMYIQTGAGSQEEAEALEEKVDSYR